MHTIRQFFKGSSKKTLNKRITTLIGQKWFIFFIILPKLAIFNVRYRQIWQFNFYCGGTEKPSSTGV